MSYTRSYSSSVTVNGSKVVNYPPNDRGGSMRVPYSETVPVQINITVETTPFDNSVHKAGASVDGLTASVAAMSAANCAAIAKNSEKISQSLINGFYNLINSDITVKKSETNSLLQAKIALLQQLSKDTTDKHTRMSDDIERLRSHYGSIFRDLDQDLAKRIKDLDRPAFSLSEKIRGNILLKPYLSIGASTVSDIDSERHTGESITIARIRHKVSEVISTMADSLSKNLLYRHMMKDTVWNESSDETELVYIPVAYMISDGINNSNRADSYYLSAKGQADRIVSSVKSYVHLKDSDGGNTISQEEFRLIDQAFSSMVEESFLDQDNTDGYNERVYSEMLRLWQNGKSDLKQL